MPDLTLALALAIEPAGVLTLLAWSAVQAPRARAIAPKPVTETDLSADACATIREGSH